MPTTPNMNLVMPDEGGSADVWDTILNDLFEVVDSHDHTTGKGVRVPFATGVTISADTPWNSGGTYYAITGIKALDFQPSAAAGMTSYAGALFVNSLDNELYWRTTGGTNVKLTSGTSINTALIGGIGGDYASVSALVDYIDASDTYRMRQQSGAGQQHYAHVAAGDLDLYEFFAHPSAVAVPTNRVRLSSPAALAASYAVTLGAALPGATSAVQISNAGALTYSNTFPNAMTFSALATFSLGAQAAAGQSFTVSTTGDYKHGDRVKVIHCGADAATVSGTFTRDVSAGYSFTAAGTVLLQFDFNTGDRVTSFTLNRKGNGVANITSIQVYRMSGFIATSIGSTSVAAPSGVAADTTIALTATTLAAGESIVVEIVASATGIQLGNASITWNRP